MRSILLLIISLSLLVSCKDKVPDVPWCRSLKGIMITQRVEGVGTMQVLRPNPVCMKEVGEPECGRCSWSMSDKVQYVGESHSHLLNDLGVLKSWSRIQKEAVLGPIGTMVEQKAFLINMCKKYKNCPGGVDRWRIKLDELVDIEPSR